jgi:hypothetical protein
MMQPVVRNPRERGTRAIGKSKKNENLLHDRMQPQGAVGKRAMVANRGA